MLVIIIIVILNDINQIQFLAQISADSIKESTQYKTWESKTAVICSKIFLESLGVMKPQREFRGKKTSVYALSKLFKTN